MFRYGVVIPFLLRILIRMRRTRTTLILHNKIINEMMDGQRKISNHLNMIKLKDQWSVV